jgi:hypothetical protein
MIVLGTMSIKFLRTMLKYEVTSFSVGGGGWGRVNIDGGGEMWGAREGVGGE